MKSILIFTLVLISNFLVAQSAIGTWKTVDDEDGQAKSHIEIYEENGKLHGKIVKLLPAAEATTCINCPGDKADKPLEGMIILYDMKPSKEKWKGGKIFDPKSGKTYKCKMELKGDNELKVRGFIGFSLLGRTQSWYRVN